MVKDYLDSIVQELFVSHAVSSFKVLKREVGDEDGYIRIKCGLSNCDILEFAEYVQIRKERINIETYSFHWQDTDGKLIKRWDNVEHHKDVDTFPHHLHLPDGTVIGSVPMCLKNVIVEIEKTLPIKEKI